MKQLVLIAMTMILLSKVNAQSLADCNNLYLDTVTFYISPQQDTIVSGNLFYDDTTMTVYPALHLILDDTSVITSPDVMWLSFLDSGNVQPFTFGIHFKTSSFPNNTVVTGLFHIYDSDMPGDSIVTCYFPITMILQNTTGIGETIENEKISIYPNPTINELKIQNNSAQPIQFTLYNSLGEKLIDKTLTNKTSTINLSSYSNDIYFYRVNDDMQVMKSGSIIKQ